MSKWHALSITPAPMNTPLRIYNALWVDEFTPTGTTEGILLGCENDPEFADLEWIGAFWNNDQDRWDTVFCDPTHWALIEEVTL